MPSTVSQLQTIFNKCQEEISCMQLPSVK